MKIPPRLTCVTFLCFYSIVVQLFRALNHHFLFLFCSLPVWLWQTKKPQRVTLKSSLRSSSFSGKKNKKHFASRESVDEYINGCTTTTTSRCCCKANKKGERAVPQTWFYDTSCFSGVFFFLKKNKSNEWRDRATGREREIGPLCRFVSAEKKEKKRKKGLCMSASHLTLLCYYPHHRRIRN